VKFTASSHWIKPAFLRAGRSLKISSTPWNSSNAVTRGGPLPSRLKLDFAKAFDFVHWDALRCVLRARGFSVRWQNWIDHLLNTSLSSVLMNGCPGPWWSCSRGLRQGDPLSPYLFLLVADVLQTLIKRDGRVKHPLAPAESCVVLKYVDDTMIVMEGNPAHVCVLKQLLDSFSKATGLCINFQKSVLVPIHMNETAVQQCVSLLGCRREGFPQTYLGLPLSLTKTRLSPFVPYMAKTDKYLAGWQAALLNPMGRLVLINSVLDSQLVYVMSSLQLLSGFVKKVDSKRRSFLWSGKDSCSGAKCLIAWGNVCSDKSEGGLGVTDLITRNTCLLLKLLHWIFTALDSSWAGWVRGRVCLATLTGDLSGDHWTTLRALLPLYRSITTCLIKDGRSTAFWFDAWLGGDDLSTKFPSLFSHAKKTEISVQEVLETGLSAHLVPRLTPQDVAERDALQLVLDDVMLSEAPDVRHCPLAAAGGNLHTGGLYRVLRNGEGMHSTEASFVWQNQAPPRVRFFGWLVNNGRVQCRVNLARKRIVEDATCEICGQAPEDTAHIFIHCGFASRFWGVLGVQIAPGHSNVLLSLLRPPTVPTKHYNMFILLCCWQLWKRRNDVVFRGERSPLATTMLLCRSEAELWRCKLRQEDYHIVAAWCRVLCVT
jgi:hypothetical protein